MIGCKAVMVEWWFGYVHTTAHDNWWHPRDHVRDLTRVQEHFNCLGQGNGQPYTTCRGSARCRPAKNYPAEKLAARARGEE